MERSSSHSIVRLAFAASAVVVACGAPPPARDTAEGAARVPGSAFVDGAGGVRLHYLDFGGSGEPIVLLAGAGDTAWIYLELGAELARDHRVLALTRRGFGDSDAPQAGYDRAALDADLVAVLDAWNAPRVTLIGHSLAGSELTHFAAHHPARVRALVYLEAAYDRSTQEAAMADAPAVYVPPTAADRASIAVMLEPRLSTLDRTLASKRSRAGACNDSLTRTATRDGTNGATQTIG
jgi:pimeloyl-ACP methyl ester carboxylesterase